MVEEQELDVYRIAMLADMTSSNVWNLFGPGASTYNYVVQAQYWPTLYGTGDQRLDLVPFLAADFASPSKKKATSTFQPLSSRTISSGQMVPRSQPKTSLSPRRSSKISNSQVTGPIM